MDHSSYKDFPELLIPIIDQANSLGKFIPGKPKTETVARDCDDHGAYAAKLDYHENLDKHYENGCPECVASQRAASIAREDERKQREAEAHMDKAIERAGITKRFRGKSFANFDVETLPQQRALNAIEKYAKNFSDEMENGRSIILHGKTGTGKNHLASALVIDLVTSGYKAILIKLFDLVEEVKQTWGDREASEQQVLNKFKHCALLVIDEVGVQFSSDAEKLIMFNVLNHRYENVKPTIVISNYPIDSKKGPSIKGVLGERVVDRLRENGGSQIPFDWKSHRK